MKPFESVDHVNLRAFDLNLLLTFDALMQDLSVTRAAARLHVQQPAMSHALAKLRLLFGDALFIRTGHTMEATAHAQLLYQAIHPILLQTQQALLTREHFDPGRAQQTFRIATGGQLEGMLMPAMMAHIGRHAPGIRLVFSPTGRGDVYTMLDEEKIDLAIGHITGGARWHHRETLYREQHACCFNPSLLAVAAPITWDAYFASQHGVVCAEESLPGYLPHLLAHADAALKVTLSSLSVMSLLAAAAESPIIANMQHRVATRYASRFGLVVSPMPFAVNDLAIDMVWHARSAQAPAMQWLRELVVACASTA
jgi:DNA-binding transcriptional LysR family regulator